METKVLLLNLTYEPLGAIPWRRAVRLVLLGRAEVLHRGTDAVGTPRGGYALPSVLRLRKRVKVEFSRVPPFSRRAVYVRDGHRCQYCGKTLTSRELTLDHVLPKSRGGVRSWTNCVTACRRCNIRKDARTPEEAGMDLRRRPFHPHQAWWIAIGVDPEGHVPDAWLPYLPDLPAREDVPSAEARVG